MFVGLCAMSIKGENGREKQNQLLMLMRQLTVGYNLILLSEEN